MRTLVDPRAPGSSSIGATSGTIPIDGSNPAVAVGAPGFAKKSGEDYYVYETRTAAEGGSLAAYVNTDADSKLGYKYKIPAANKEQLGTYMEHKPRKCLCP